MELNISIEVKDETDGDMLVDIVSGAGQSALEVNKERMLEVDEQVDITEETRGQLSYLNPAREHLVRVLYFRTK